MESSASEAQLDLRCIQYEIDQRSNKLYSEYLNKKTDYVQTTKDLFRPLESSSKGSLIELGDFEPINYNVKYTMNTLQMVDKGHRTGVLNLADRGYTSVPEFVWTFGMPVFEGSDLFQEASGSVVKNTSRSKKNGKVNQTPLVYLDLSKNFIESFVPKAPLEHVEFLKLSYCQLKTISEKVLLFRSLKVLLLGNNKLTMLPSCLGYLDNLEELDVHCNNLTSLPPNLCNIHSLKRVNISGNQFISISSFDVAIRNLEEIKASSNLLINVAEGIQLLNSLKIVDVSNNQLTILPNLCYMPYLQIFFANSNNLVIFPNFAGCKRLNEIQLKSNRIQEFDIESLQFVPVEILLLNDNKIQTLPQNVNELSNLVCLGLSNNCIKNLPYQLALIPTLHDVTIEGNPIENVDDMRKSPRDLLAYLLKQYKLIKIADMKRMEKTDKAKQVKEGNTSKVVLVTSSIMSNKNQVEERKRPDPLLATTRAKEFKKISR